MVQRGVRLTRREPKHRLFDLANALINHGKIETTFARAKELAVHIEPLIEKAKTPDLSSRRDLLKSLGKKQTQKLLEEIAPRFRNIKGGYTRIRRTAQRRGDATLMSTIEILEGEKIEIKDQPRRLRVGAPTGTSEKSKTKKEDKEKGRRRKSPKPSIKTAKQSERKSASKAKSRKHP